jgi:hypothetical protein
MGFLTMWGPFSVKEMKGRSGADWVGLAHMVQPHTLYLMRDNNGAPVLLDFSSSNSFSPAPKQPLLCLGSTWFFSCVSSFDLSGVNKNILFTPFSKVKE